MCTSTRKSAIRKCDVNVDRTKADQLGLTQRDVANSMLISLSSSGQTRAQPVAESAERRELPGGGADPAVSHRFLRRAAAHAHHSRQRGERQHRNC